MKHKFKPVAKAELRKRVEQKFRARGAVAFHLLLILGFGIVLLYNLPDLWLMRRGNSGFFDYTIPYVFLSAAGALHFIRYYFRHGRGRDRHEAEIERRIERQLRHASAEDAEEQEELARLQMDDKLKNRRLVWQHVVIFIAIVSIGCLSHLQYLRPSVMFDWSRWQSLVSFVGIWGIGLAAHVLRYVFAYAISAEGREAKIEAQVARELEQNRQSGATDAGRAIESVDAARSLADSAAAEFVTADDLEAAQERATN